MAEDLLNAPEKSVAVPERDYRELEPPPDERLGIPFKRKPGQLKRDKFWLLDPSPDAVSLTFLPRDGYGFVDWARAIREGLIAPKEFLPTAEKPPEKDPDFDKDVLIRAKVPFMPDVLFPHAIHNTWLKCGVCHPKMFEMKAGGGDADNNDRHLEGAFLRQVPRQGGIPHQELLQVSFGAKGKGRAAFPVA